MARIKYLELLYDAQNLIAPQENQFRNFKEFKEIKNGLISEYQSRKDMYDRAFGSKNDPVKDRTGMIHKKYLGTFKYQNGKFEGVVHESSIWKA